MARRKTFEVSTEIAGRKLRNANGIKPVKMWRIEGDVVKREAMMHLVQLEATSNSSRMLKN